METISKDHQEILKLDGATVHRLLVDFIRDQTHNAGFMKGVVGVSGGVDSAVSAFLTAEALGKENTLAVIMPYRTSNPQSVEDAKLVADSLGIRSELVDISETVDAYCASRKITDRVRCGNVMARARMIVLYDISARDKALVIGTSNKSEILVGYGTLHGDMASAINPLGDLYKTQVLQLAEVLGIPERVIKKKPSADLWDGQTDEAELGVKYAQLDQLLFYMIDERLDEKELKRMGFKQEMIAKVSELVRKNQFKRRPPIIAKISHRTVNVDFRYVRDWGT
jgi:NAD+ synthase